MIGVVADSDFELELNKLTNHSVKPQIRGSVTNIIRPGRSTGDVNVPDSLRKIIGETNELDSRTEAIQLGRAFGISPSSVSAYANGATSTDSYNEPKPELKNHINEAKERIGKKARARLREALEHLTADKLSEAKAVELASVAKSMSSISKEMEPESDHNKLDTPQYIIYAPQFRDERSFEVIQVSE